MKQIPIENRNAVKDMGSKAVLSTDLAALQAHKRQKLAHHKIESLELKVDALESKIDALINLITKTIQDK